MKKALILGVDGQDGSYLAEFLLEKDYDVIGWVPEGLPRNDDNLKSFANKIDIVEGNLKDQESIDFCIQETQPDEVYNLASPSFAAGSWESVELLSEVAALGVMRILEALRKNMPEAHFFQASSSEIFGQPLESPQNENTPYNPQNPYGIAKLYAHCMTAAYRQKYNLFAVSGILFNHESVRRGFQFVTRKITDGAARIALGLSHELRLGDLDATRDWGFAGDTVQAMWMMLQAESPEDFVIGTGKLHSVREICELAFSYFNLDYQKFVIQDDRFLRPREIIPLQANPQKINEKLGWYPKVSFKSLILDMVKKDADRLRIANQSSN